MTQKRGSECYVYAEVSCILYELPS